jgi:hypothetical protein
MRPKAEALGYLFVPAWRRAVALSRDAHLSEDEAVAKMGHLDLWWREGEADSLRE